MLSTSNAGSDLATDIRWFGVPKFVPQPANWRSRGLGIRHVDVAVDWLFISEDRRFYITSQDAENINLKISQRSISCIGDGHVTYTVTV